MSLTVACVWVRGNVPYSVEYVTRLRTMVARHLPDPHRFVCLTDRPEQLPAGMLSALVEPVPRKMFGWWRKIELFRPGRFDGRVLYLDLDSLVVGALGRVVSYQSPFALLPHEGSFQPRSKHQIVRRFNSSVMVWDAGVNGRVFDAWSPSVTKLYWGDQDLIGALCPEADTMPLAWFPRLSAVAAGPVPSEAVVVLAKKPKPEEAARQWPWVSDVWHAV